MNKLTCFWSIHFLLCASVFSIFEAELHAADFPQWRGPNRDGHSLDTGLLKEWPQDGPKLLWQANHVGAGYSTPSVASDRLYIISNEDGEESVLALNAKDGAQVWTTKIGKVGHPEQNPSYPGSRSTPTIDGGLLFALGSDGDLVCLETATGKQVWHKHLRNDFDGQYGEWAYAESPLVDGDKVICTPGDTNATMIALDKKTGDLIWKCAVPEGTAAGYASAVVAELSGVKQYIQFLSSGLMGVDAKTGNLLWRYEKTGKGSPAVIITPIVSDGLVYSGAFRATAALVKPMLEDGTFTVEEVYSANKLPYSVGGVVKLGDFFYGNGNQSTLCVDFKSGDIKWEERALGPCSWLTADDRIYVHAENGDVGLIEPSADGYKEKGRFTPPNLPDRANQMEKAWAYPVIANGKLYIRDKNQLWCYDVRAE